MAKLKYGPRSRGWLSDGRVRIKPPHGGLKEILQCRKAPGAKVINPADGKVVRPPPASE